MGISLRKENDRLRERLARHGDEAIPFAQRSLYSHDPAAGVFGDCHRACIAAILGLAVADVPHFLHDNCDSETFEARVDDFLKPLGLKSGGLFFPGDLPVSEVIKSLSYTAPGIPAILGGKSERGFNHSVVIMDGHIVCDPSGSGIIGPCEPGGLYVINFLAVRGPGGPGLIV